MNIFHKVTLKSLKKNRTRTIVTIIGIMLSTALLCAVTTSISSLRNYLLRFMIYSEGSWHGCNWDADLETYESIKESDEISGAVCGQQLGYADIGSKNESKPYLYVIGSDKSFADMMSVHLTSGRLPETSDEILLPEHLAKNGKVIYELGDTLELNLGERDYEGETLNQTIPFDDSQSGSTETLSIRETRTYTVVGFCERPGFESLSAPGYTAFTAADTENLSAYQYDVYFTMKEPKDVYSFIDKNKLYGDTNTDVLMCLGVTSFDTFYSVIYSLAAIIICLIMFGSVSLIYNAFSISVSERTKQFGLLSSIGATKKQLRGSVFFEVLTVSVIGIPLGILLGITGIGTTLKLIGKKISSLFITDAVEMKICISPAALIIAVAVGLITVLISAFIPAKRATKISAIEAIRQNSDIKSEKKAIKTPKLVYKLFGLPGMLAHKYFKRNRKKYRATVMSLFMSIVLFVSASSFTDYLVESAEGSFGTFGYDIRYSIQYDSIPEDIDPDLVLKKINMEETVDYASYSFQCSSSASVPSNLLSDNIGDYFMKSSDDDSKYDIPVTLYFINDDEFRSLLKENSLDENKFMDRNSPLAVAVDGFRFFNAQKEKFVNVNMLDSDTCTAEMNCYKDIDGYYFDGTFFDKQQQINYLIFRNENDPDDTIEYREDEQTLNIPLKSGKTIYKKPYYVESQGSLIFVYPSSFMSAVIPENAECQPSFFIRIKTGDHSVCYSSVENLIDSGQIPDGSLNDYAKAAESERNLITIVKVFAYGFIILISLIAAANVFNTISTNISLRRREFAMLKSIGMTGRDFNRMMNFECILYGAKSLILGLPAAFAITYLIYRSVSEGFETSFRLPWKATAIAVLSVFAVVFSTMLYSMSKIKKGNPIDALKNENI